MTGYLHHGHGTSGPFRTEAVPVKLSGWRPGGQCWLARYEGRWRKVHVRVAGLFVVYRGERIAAQIEGV